MTAAPSKLSRAIKLGGHAFWNTAGFIFSLGMERLLIHPIMKENLGAEAFGAFIWMLGLVNLFGQVAANGFAIVMLRDFTGKSADEQQLMARQSLLMSIWLTTALLIVAAIGAMGFGGEAIRDVRAPLTTMLIVFAVVRSLELVLITLLRIRRQFLVIFGLRVLEGIVLLGNLWASSVGSFWLIGAVYVVSMVAPTAFALWREPLIGTRGPWWQRDAAYGLLMGWVGGAVLTLTEQGQMYAPRLVLGPVAGEAAVTVLYSGVSISNLFVAPVSILGGLVMALLAGNTGYALAGRRHKLYLIAATGSALLVGLVSQFIGMWLVERLYPQEADQTRTFYHWIAISNAFTTLTLLLRPVAIKYLSMRLVNSLSAVSVVLQIGALAILTPMYEARGAAMALAASSAVATCFWIYTYFQSRSWKKVEPDAVTPGSDEG
ncbi:MAG: hypothetical protein KDA32_02410 [Phycisphaerales bacterium]|nr:hypothetical protein [Phycisphaerales bacterium]